MHVTQDDVQSIVQIITQHISDVKAIYLFGSQNSDDATSQSDVDIAYLSTSSVSNLQRWELSCRIAAVLKKDVDLVDLQTTDTIFRFQIVSKGRRLYGEGLEVEKFEDLAYSFYLRFTEERKPIVDAIKARKSIFGDTDV